MIRVENDWILGRDLHLNIESKTKQYNVWVLRAIENADLKDGKDFCTFLYESTGGRPQKEYKFTIDAAKEICLLERNEKGKELRRWLINLSNKQETGKLFSPEQISFLIDLTKVMGLFSVQNKVENDHFNFHNNKYDWWDYRAKILGYGTNQLKIEVEKLNRKYKSMKQALILTDRYELVRIGVIDLFIALGKTPEFASNVADLCKDMAKKMDVPIWDDSSKKNSLPLKPRVNEGLESSIKNNQLKLK